MRKAAPQPASPTLAGTHPYTTHGITYACSAYACLLHVHWMREPAPQPKSYILMIFSILRAVALDALRSPDEVRLREGLFKGGGCWGGRGRGGEQV